MILEVIKAKYAYEAKTGQTANTVYVGREEWDKLRLEASEHWDLNISGAHEDGRRLECNGLAVFVVNATSHFNVCAVERN